MISGGGLKSKRFIIISAMFFFYALIRSIISHFEFVDIEKLTLYSNYEFVVISIASTIVLFNAALIFPKNSENRVLLMLITTAYFFWTLGESTWAYYELVLKEENPFPSFADVFYLVAFIPIIYSLVRKARSIEVPVRRSRLAFLLVLMLVITVLSSYLVLYPILISEEPIVTLLVSLAYPLLDLILISSVFLLLGKYAGGLMERVWLIFATAMLCDGIADTLFSYEEWQETYTAYSWSDDLFIWSYLLTILFAIAIRQVYSRLQR